KPRLVVLASCQGAGTGAGEAPAGPGALAALGPRLVGAGIPAVVAMQGDVSMGTVRVFMPAFFEALRPQNGLVDRAPAAARGPRGPGGGLVGAGAVHAAEERQPVGRERPAPRQPRVPLAAAARQAARRRLHGVFGLGDAGEGPRDDARERPPPRRGPPLP